MSLNNILNKEDKKAEAQVVEARTDKPGEEEIVEKWKQCAEIFADRPRLANAVATSQVQISEGAEGIEMTFLVANDAQVEWIRSNALKKLEGRLRQLLRWNEISLDVARIEAGAIQKEAYTPEEKYAAMREANPELAALISDMDATLK